MGCSTTELPDRNESFGEPYLAAPERKFLMLEAGLKIRGTKLENVIRSSVKAVRGMLRDAKSRIYEE